MTTSFNKYGDESKLYALDVANYYMWQHGSSPSSRMTPMKLVKLVYIAHGWHLGLTGEELFKEENAEAWVYGPVVPSIYHHYKRFGADFIPADYVDTQSAKKLTRNEFSQQRSLIDSVWRVYGKFDGIELSEMTHQKGSPWDETWNTNGGRHYKGVIIPVNLIMGYYQNMMKENKQKAGIA